MKVNYSVIIYYRGGVVERFEGNFEILKLYLNVNTHLKWTQIIISFITGYQTTLGLHCIALGVGNYSIAKIETAIIFNWILFG